MNMLPGPAQAAAIGLSIALPLLLLVYARIAATGGSGRRFRLGCVTIMAFYAVACIALARRPAFCARSDETLVLITAIEKSFRYYTAGRSDYSTVSPRSR